MTTAWAIPVRGPKGVLNIPDYDPNLNIGGFPNGQQAINKNYVDNKFLGVATEDYVNEALSTIKKATVNDILGIFKGGKVNE